MTQYKYATVLEAQDDGQPPNDNIEAGDLIVRAGRHDSDSDEYITDDGEIDTIEYEAAAVYESDHKMTEREAVELARDEWFADDD